MDVIIREYKPGVSGGLRERLALVLSRTEGKYTINYGCSFLGLQSCLNPPGAIKNCVDKQQMLRELRKGVGKLFTCPQLIEKGEHVGDNQKVVMKPIRHKGGKGVKILQNLIGGRHTRSDVYLEEFVPCTREWRVDVVGGRTSARLKAGGRGEIRNHRYGWTFTYPSEPAGRTVRQAAVAAVKALGLDFGAVDIGEREGMASGLRNVPVVYEVNSAPRLTSPTITEWYARHMGDLIRSKL